MTVDNPSFSRSCRVFLAVVDAAVPPDEITAALGLSPDRVTQIGHPTASNPNRLATFNKWTVLVRVDEAADVDEHLRALVAMMMPIAPALQSLATTATVQVEIVIDYEYFGQGRRPSVDGISLDRELVELAGKVGARFDIDISI